MAKKASKPKTGKPSKTPRPRRTGGTGWQHTGKPSAKQAQFLAAYAQCGNITHACAVAGVSRSMHGAWRKSEDYVQRFEEAHEQACDALEKEARRRAVEGFDEPVFGSGGKGFGTVQVGNIRKYSDTLLIFMLKGARPEKFRENSRVQFEGNLNHTGNVQIFIPDNDRDSTA